MPEGFPTAEESRPFPVLATAVELLGAFGMMFCLAMFFLAMRGIMDLGGFVARGGPYEIAHPAPNWFWVVPVSIWAGLFFGAMQFVGAQIAGGFTLVSLGWSATFLGGGWNFFEYGFNPPGGGGLAWAWIVCGVVFVGMGLPGLVGLIAEVSLSDKASRGMTAMLAGLMKERAPMAGTRRLVYAILNLAALAGGTVAGVVFFQRIAGGS